MPDVRIGSPDSHLFESQVTIHKSRFRENVRRSRLSRHPHDIMSRDDNDSNNCRSHGSSLLLESPRA